MNGDGLTKVVELPSLGMSVTVGKLSWSAYKRIKSLVMQQLTRDGLELLELLRNGNKDSLELLASKVMSVLGELDLDYAVGCIVRPDTQLHTQAALATLDQEKLSFEEAGELISAATVLNPLDKILAFEKNSATAGLVRSLMQTFNPAGAPSVQSFLNGVGGSASSPPSPSDTAGIPPA